MDEDLPIDIHYNKLIGLFVFEVFIPTLEGVANNPKISLLPTGLTDDLWISTQMPRTSFEISVLAPEFTLSFPMWLIGTS